MQSKLPLIVPIAPINIGNDLVPSASPLALQVTLAGAFEQLSHLTSADVSATVDLTGLGPGEHRLPVLLVVPAGLQVVAPAQPEVSITLTAVPTPTALPATPTTSPTRSP